jgi:hypothetical protein
MTQTLEIVRTTLKPDSEERMLAARQPAIDELRANCAGLVAAYLAKLEDGSYVDVVVWESMELARAAAKRAPQLPACAELFSTIGDDLSMEHAEIVHAVTDGRS